MGTEENQTAVFKFLLDHFRSQEPFTKNELADHASTETLFVPIGLSSTSNYSQLLTQIPFASARHLDPIRHGKAFEASLLKYATLLPSTHLCYTTMSLCTNFSCR